MLEGTDLYSAYAPLMPTAKEEPIMMASSGDAIDTHAPQQQMESSKQYAADPPANPTMSTAASFHEQYEKEQKLIAIINELKKRQAAAVSGGGGSGPSYWDKLMAKKKDIIKFLQSALIIVFALSVHFLISHYFQQYISSNDVSFERELILRLLYPIGIVFIAWNVMLIFK